MPAVWFSVTDGCMSMIEQAPPTNNPTPRLSAALDMIGQARRWCAGLVRGSSSGPPLVPSENIAGRALVTVIAIMTFLAALTAVSAQMIASAASDWQMSVATEMTIQVRPVAGRNIDQDVTRIVNLASTFKGIREVKAYSKQDSEKLLEPWLGSGLSFDVLPIPRLIVLKIEDGALVDSAGLRKAITEQWRHATLDDHRVWIARLAAMARSVVAVAIGLVGLVMIATALAVAFATRGAMAGNRSIMEALHFVGATDAFIAREFERHFLVLGLKGGALGGFMALVFFGAAHLLAGTWLGSPGGEQMETLFGSFAIGYGGYLAVVMVTVAVAFLTALVSRVTVTRTLGTLT
jgi:cell division transport system permease protein